MGEKIKIIECPRDAMQGLEKIIPTEIKSAYFNRLLSVGFHTLDFGSFVSHKLVPQMKDTTEVLDQIQKGNTNTRLLAIVANTRGAEMAIQFDKVYYLGFPLSLSATFQMRNTNKTIEEAMDTVKEIHRIGKEKGRVLVVYLSMGFGNPYGEDYSIKAVTSAVEALSASGISVIALSDTIGTATPKLIRDVVAEQVSHFPDIEWGVHLHSRSGEEEDKILAALEAGCRRFDGAILGFGGCPMANDDLVGNIPTEQLVRIVKSKGFETGIDEAALNEALKMAQQIFH
ncbi:MAG: hydroxymethylglutaryl-CoA lyase [Cyclobacteriaceae bacterium]